MYTPFVKERIFYYPLQISNFKWEGGSVYNTHSACYFLACVAGLYTTLENGGVLSALSELIAFVKFAHYSA